MTTTTYPNGIAPVNAGNYQLGAKGGRMAQAWQYVWNRLNTHSWTDGMQISRDAAAEFNLKPVSVSEMLCRMRAAGVIEQEMIVAPTTYARAQYRTEYGPGDWDAVIELTPSQVRFKVDGVLERVVPEVRSAIGSDWVDREDLFQYVISATALEPSDVGTALQVMLDAGMILIRRELRDCLYTSNRKRVHYRIAKGA